jgi:hypothetical protein
MISGALLALAEEFCGLTGKFAVVGHGNYCKSLLRVLELEGVCKSVLQLTLADSPFDPLNLLRKNTR